MIDITISNREVTEERRVYSIVIEMYEENFRALDEFIDIEKLTPLEVGNELMYALRTHAFPEEMRYAIG